MIPYLGDIINLFGIAKFYPVMKNPVINWMIASPHCAVMLSPHIPQVIVHHLVLVMYWSYFGAKISLVTKLGRKLKPSSSLSFLWLFIFNNTSYKENQDGFLFYDSLSSITPPFIYLLNVYFIFIGRFSSIAWTHFIYLLDAHFISIGRYG